MVKNLLDSDKILVVLEVANNHQGDVDHANALLENYHHVLKNYRENMDFAFKFQYRDLPTFIHQDYVDSEIKYVRRFLDTQLTEDEWLEILHNVRNYDYFTMCTPFDETSVDKVIKDNYDILKIASASLDDWPLVEHIGNLKNDKPIIASVGGADLEKIKRFYSFMKNKKNLHLITVLACIQQKLKI